MKHTRHATALAALVLVPLLRAQEKPVAPANPAPVAAEAVVKKQVPANLLVGVVDLPRAIEQYPKAIEMQKQLVELGKNSRGQLEQIGKRMDEVRGAMDVLGDNAPDRRQNENELQMLQLQRQLLAKSLDERFELARVKMMLEVYADAEAAIAKVAKAKGLHLVHCTHDDPTPMGDLTKLGQRDALSRLSQFETRSIWYAAKELDVTEDVIKVLMIPAEDPKDAKAGKPASAAGGAAPSTAPKDKE